MAKDDQGAAAEPLIGRTTLRAELIDHVLAHPCTTLVGPGGIGKTRLARNITAHFAVSDTFSDGLYWVDLAPLSAATAVSAAIAQACKLAEHPRLSWLETVLQALQSQRALLILDNCEHVRAACAEIVTQLLAACSHLHILTTSREPLAAPNEAWVAIPPLALAEAATLFTLRASVQQQGFVLDHSTQTAVETICTQLDGLPLAIEFAAARMALLSVHQIAERMQQSLTLLASREPHWPPRQRSLRAVLDWSYELLQADEQALLDQLAVFAGSFDLDAVEAVCLVLTPLDALAELVDKSLVTVVPNNEKLRYRLHEVVRQYALEHLQATTLYQPLRLRQLQWIAELATQAEQAFKTAERDPWLARLSLEQQNIRTALQTAAELDHKRSMLHIAGVLSPWWNSFSIREGREWLALARSHAPTEMSLESVQAWNCESFLAYRQGDYAAMYAAANTALQEALHLEYAEGIAAAHYRLGIYHEMKSNTVAARTHYQLSLELLRDLNDRRAMSQIFNGLAHVANLEAKPAEAQAYYQQGLQLARTENDRLMIALLLISWANLTLDSGDFDAAEAAYSESLLHLRAIQHESYMLYAINGLGEVAHYRHDFATAIEHYQQGLYIAQTLGLTDMQGQFQAHLGRTEMARGNLTEAAHLLSAALRMYVPLERPKRTAGIVHFCASLIFVLGYPAHAVPLFVAGLKALETTDFTYLGSDGPILQAHFDQARSLLRPTEQTLAIAAGEALTLAQAAERALSQVFLPQRPLASAATPELRIFLFGSLRVLRQEAELTNADWVYGKTKDLLIFLLLVDSADKAQIGAALWPDASPEQLKQNFRMAIYHLRRALGSAAWIIFKDGRYAFNSTPEVWVDLHAFEQAVAHARSDPAQRVQQLRTAAALYSAELDLGTLESELLVIRREQLHQIALDVLLTLGQLYAEGGQQSAASDTYRQALSLDLYNEIAHRGLMRSLALQGASSDALAHYQRLVDRLAHEFNAAPAAETIALVTQIQAGTPF